MSCLDLLPSGSCQKRRALFADGPPVVPVKKKKSNRPHLLKKKTFGDNSALGKIAWSKNEVIDSCHLSKYLTFRISCQSYSQKHNSIFILHFYVLFLCKLQFELSEFSMRFDQNVLSSPFFGSVFLFSFSILIEGRESLNHCIIFRVKLHAQLYNDVENELWG